MLINAELLLQYQRCQRRTFLDTHADQSQRDVPNELLLKLQQDKTAHRRGILAHFTCHKPDYPYGNWEKGHAATLELMRHGVEYIHQGVLLINYQELASAASENILSPHHEKYTLLSRPDLFVKQPGQSCFGDWVYVPANIELGKRPKQEYQVVAAFHALVLATVQKVAPPTAWLILRTKKIDFAVDLAKWTPQTQQILEEFIQVI